MRKMPNSVVLVYVLLGYVVLQFAWWAYLIYDLNHELILATNTEQSGRLLKGKLYMVLGEGTVFLTLLISGAIYIRHYLMREKKLAEQERNFLLATTHELNSPLAGLKLNLQTLERPEINSEQGESMIQSGLMNVTRLENLIQNILMAAHLDSKKLKLLTEPVILHELISEVLAKLEPQTNEAQLKIKLEKSDNSINGDKKALSIVISNLVTNAIKYAPGSNVSFSMARQKTSLILEYRDDGPGISAENLNPIFRKFYRIENEETRTNKGTGLGLYLTKELIGLHNGNIVAKQNSPAGLIFEISLPIK